MSIKRTASIDHATKWTYFTPETGRDSDAPSDIMGLTRKVASKKNAEKDDANDDVNDTLIG